MTREEVLKELEGGDLPTLDALLRESKSLLAARVKVQKRGSAKGEEAFAIEEEDEEGEDEGKDEDEDEDEGEAKGKSDSVHHERVLAESDTFESLQALLDEPDSESQAESNQVEATEPNEWNLGKLMRSVGVDPDLFGWDEDQEDFVR